MSTLIMISMTLTGIIGFILYPVMRWGWRFSVAPFCAVFSIISLLYVFGLMNLLPLGIYFVFACSVALTFLAIYQTRMELSQDLAKLLSPPAVVFFILFFILGVLSRSWTLHDWDEFSHWGIFAKAMYFENKFPAQVSFVTVWPHYPPGMTIFHYYVTRLAGYSEKAVYFGQSIVILSAILVLLKDASWRKGFLVLGLVVFGYWAVYFWGYSVNTIYQDGLLGVVFGAGVAAYYGDEKRGWNATAKVAPLLFILPLIKELGIIFALIITGIVMFDQLMNNKDWNAGIRSILSRKAILSFLRSVSILIIPFISFFSWKFALGFWKTIVPERNVNPGDLLTAFSFWASDAQRGAIAGFLSHYQNTKIGYAPWAGMGILIVFVALLFIYSFLRPESGYNRGRGFQILLALGFLFYSSVMLAFFILVDPLLQSYTRYLGTYCLGWSYAVFSIFASEIQSNDLPVLQPFSHSIIAVLCTIFILFILALTPLTNIFTPPASFPPREAISVKIKRLLPYMEADSRVWIIWQNSSGLEFHIIRYLIAPHNVNGLNTTYKWSLGKPYGESDLWTYNIAPLEWEKELITDNYKYILVAKADSQFWETYGDLFCDSIPMNAYQLFKVESSCFKYIAHN